MIRIPLINDLSRSAAHRAIDAAKEGDDMEIKASSKTRDQEAAYHAIFSDVARQCRHLNRALDLESWKRLLIDQFRRDMLSMPDCDTDIRANLQDSVTMMPSLDGSAIVAIGLQSRKFRRKTAAAFLEWLNAWAAQNDVRLSAPKHMGDAA